MDELEISGRRYISSVRAAKEHKYHSDYIGQLVRGGKVTGQKVGRAWYVDADSLAEYLGKEVPARGPMPQASKMVPFEEKREESFERPVAEPKINVRGLSEEAQQTEPNVPERDFIMPLRKSGRAHIIAAIDEVQVVPTPKKIIEPIVEEMIEQTISATVDEPKVADDEERFIPLKIDNEKTRNIYEEPEDSFYKVSHKGLRYVKQQAAPAVVQKEKTVAAARTYKAGHSLSAIRAVSLILVAGVLSLGAGVLMSYYLHSITLVQGEGQSSSVILSN